MKPNAGPIQHRPSYFEVGRGVAVEFIPGAHPGIQWKHVDGPMLHMRNGQVHWLTFWERFLCWLGRADAFTLERKHAPKFVERWNARLIAEGHVTAANAKAYGVTHMPRERPK